MFDWRLARIAERGRRTKPALCWGEADAKLIRLLESTLVTISLSFRYFIRQRHIIKKQASENQYWPTLKKEGGSVVKCANGAGV